MSARVASPISEKELAVITPANSRSPLEIIEGPIEQSTATGIRIGGVRSSVSKFKPVEVPPTGTRVRLQVDDKRFIVSLEVLDPSVSDTEIALRSGSNTRLVAMQTAAQLVGAFAQTHEEVKVDHVFPLADRILAWLEKTD
jgi:hypothetical protein